MKKKLLFSSHAVKTGAFTIVHYNFSSRFVHSLAQRVGSSDGFHVVLFEVFLIIKCFLKPFELTFALKL